MQKNRAKKHWTEEGYDLVSLNNKNKINKAIKKKANYNEYFKRYNKSDNKKTIFNKFNAARKGTANNKSKE